MPEGKPLEYLADINVPKEKLGDDCEPVFDMSKQHHGETHNAKLIDEQMQRAIKGGSYY